MNARYILPLNSPQATLETVGGKGASLARMAGTDLPVPGGFHITTAAYRRFAADNDLQPLILKALEAISEADPQTLEAASRAIRAAFETGEIPGEVASQIIQAYSAQPGASPAMAVRSSATAEDLPEASFAGQQETYLNVSGADQVLEAVRKCWASLWTARAIGYRARQGIGPEGVALAVVVQRLVPAEAAGILFTANPLNGRRDQALINASWGLGEAVVGGMVTPDTLTIEKEAGAIVSREIARKEIQTLLVAGGTEERPVPENLQEVPVLTDGQAAELAVLGDRIEALYGMPMDIEWTLADGEFAIVQARPITALPEPEPPVPTEWNLPKGAYIAMRNNIVELMADPLTPLFKTLGLAAVNTCMDRMLSGFFGSNGVLPKDPIIAVNEYAYYNGSIRFGSMLKIILNTRGILKRMFTDPVGQWTEAGRPQYQQVIDAWAARPWETLSNAALLDAVRELAEAAIDAYMSLVSGILPAAWMSEAWFTFIYRLVRTREGAPAPTYLMGFESQPIRSEKALYDLAVWARGRITLAKYIAGTPAKEIAVRLDDETTPTGISQETWMEWQARFQTYLFKFGHMIYNLDFANPVLADDPVPALDTLKLFLSGQGTDPHARQAEAAARREAATQAIERQRKGWSLNLFRKNLARAQKYAPLREDGLADVGMSYPLLRRMLLTLGSRFVQNGMIEAPGDIFWLDNAEVEAAAARLDRGEGLASHAAQVQQRRAVWRSARKEAPPLMLPQIKIFGVDLIELKSGVRRKGGGTTLKGVAASPGTVTGPACVVHGPEDFGQMNPGDILVAPLTTPAWTPLFARAAGIVTDVGGPLSHGSIVAREYGIPAVLGTGAATTTIATGQVITVDGDGGVVILSRNGK